MKIISKCWELKIKHYGRIYFQIHPRIFIQPTQFQNSAKISKIKFSWNLTKIFIFPESAQSTDSFLIFLSEKNDCTKKLVGVPYPGIQPRYYNLWKALKPNFDSSGSSAGFAGLAFWSFSSKLHPYGFLSILILTFSGCWSGQSRQVRGHFAFSS